MPYCDAVKFLCRLALGQWLHVGKHATFGLGQYRIEEGRKLA
jgi:CRISPR/Cas system endoribonuclease Cas6 (RAMP superfamily)